MQKWLQQTFHPLMPVVLIGTAAQAMLFSVFSTTGFFAEIFNLSKWLPGFRLLHDGFGLLTTYTIGLLGLLTAIFAARAITHREAQHAAIIAGIAYLILNTSRMTNFGPNIGVSGLLFGLLFGSLVGWWFNHLPKAFATVSTLLLTIVTRLSWDHATATHVLAFNAPRGSWLLPLNSLFGWLGLPTPIDVMMPMLTGTKATANLNAALAHHPLPNPMTIGTIYRPYAMFGGVGMTLGLLIAILLVDQRVNKRRLAWWSLPMSLVNLNLPLLLGYPILLQPLMLIPFVCAPLASCAIAWSALALHFMSAAVYQVPATTPGVMIAWLSTDGNWPALLVTILCLVVSVLIYLPFVKKVSGGERLD
ncbi:PTS sugar transporter subunit IIC [Lacticaseibacillus porcinae]|uniref:PTS sugar transporter subunit IIC n=1 Tax=Lacticaseibacillus porcinae TaxID=1123687 RepID=UPI0013DE2C16|nr:PTS sugar transporter subunit IIC [Lacticaseibacillus porcinae]